jgi:hypothetical protein
LPGMHTVHCSICNKAVKGSTFKVRMARLRRHRKEAHPGAHRKSVRKALETKKLDPLRRRPLMVAKYVKGYIDYNGKATIRVLDRRPEMSLLPEFALYVKFRNMPHNIQDQMLKNAGLREEARGKWVLRSDNLSLFVYV